MTFFLVEPAAKLVDSAELDESMLAAAFYELIGLYDAFTSIGDPCGAARRFREVGKFVEKHGIRLRDVREMSEVFILKVGVADSRRNMKFDKKTYQKLFTRIFAERFGRHCRAR